MNAMSPEIRRTDQPVRRDSYDVDDPRANVFRQVQGGIAFVDAYLDVFDQWADMIKKKGEQHELNANCRKVLAALLRKCIDFKTGVCEPCIDTLMRLTCLARATIVRALARLAKYRFIDWVRRTVRTDNAPGEGPLVRQVSNAYFLVVDQLPKRVIMALQQKLRKKKVDLKIEPSPRKSHFKGWGERRAKTVRGRRDNLAAALAAAPPEHRAAILYPDDPEMQREYNDMLLGSRASSGSSLNPPSSTLREVD